MAPPQLAPLQVDMPPVFPIPLLLVPLMPPPQAANSNTAQVDSPARRWRIEFDPSMV
jgi:hypothetical protein